MKTNRSVCFLLFFVWIAVANASRNQLLDPADDPRNIYRPCEDFNIDCIRNFFWTNSECAISQGPVPDPLFLDCYKVDVANTNWTAYVYDVNVEGLNGEVIEFYYNLKTKKLVLAVEMHNLRLRADDVRVLYLRRAKEPLERCGFVDYKYDKVTMTAIIPKCDKLDLRNAVIYSYIDDAAPEFALGDGIGANLDPKSQIQYQKYLNEATINIREIFFRQGTDYMANYIQYNICDFGIKLNTFGCPYRCPEKCYKY